ncbi:MAG: thioesterase family protein [Kiritimatiellae bacterium]|nr:thioesterase family protein [Kiritimatiellia bacterium]MDW8458161.1 thioesterase family protein [Verrucomicrobiota bacterium]
MPRQKIILPETWLYETVVPIRITDLNYGRHVGNDTILGLLQEARVRWLRSLGYDSELLEGSLGLILVDLAVRFRSELTYGDDLLVRLTVSEWSHTGFELAYLGLKASDRSEAVRALTGLVFFDYASKRIAAAPPDFRSRVEHSGPPR